MNTELIHHWYGQYRVGIYRFSLSILKDPQLAEDVLQETFLRIISGKGFPAPGKEQAFLYRIARNICYDILRKQKHEAEERPDAPAPAEHRWEFIDLIAPLSPKEQEIVSLKIIGGLTHREIAKVMGITTAGAKKRYERAIQKLREEMEVHF